MKYFLLISVIFLGTWTINSQIQTGIWEGDDVLGGEYVFNAVKNIRNNGYILVGSKSGENGEKSDVYVVRLNEDFEVLWSKRIGGDEADRGMDVQLTRDDGFIIVGTTDSFDVPERKIYVIKLDASGEIEWSQIVGKNGYAQEAFSIKATRDNGFILAGSTDTQFNRLDAYIVKLDSWGELEWDKIIGGEEDDVANTVDIAADGGYIVAGKMESEDHQIKRAYFIKLDNEGDLQWTSLLAATFRTEITDIVTVEENYYAVGTVYAQAMKMKLRPDGTVEWMNSYTDPSYASDFKRVIAKENGSIFALGNRSSNFYIAETKPDGVMVHSQRYFGQHYYYGYGMDITDDEGFISVGRKRRRYGTPTGEFGYIIKTNKVLRTCDPPTYVNYYMPQALPGRDSMGTIRNGNGRSKKALTREKEGAGLGVYCYESLDVEDFKSESEIKVYPNPTQGIFYIKSDLMLMNISIYNSMGQKVFASEIENTSASISPENLAPGIYHIRIRTENGVHSERIVIAH